MIIVSSNDNDRHEWIAQKEQRSPEIISKYSIRRQKHRKWTSRCMINKKDEEIIISFAKMFDVKEIYLFGSSLDQGHEANDIDLAIKGIVLAYKKYVEERTAI